MIPPDIGFYLALKLSDGSRSYTRDRDVVPEHSIHQFFESKLAEGYDGLIYGHTHKPGMVNRQWNGRDVVLINSGDWIEHANYVSVMDGKISLEEFAGD